MLNYKRVDAYHVTIEGGAGAWGPQPGGHRREQGLFFPAESSMESCAVVLGEIRSMIFFALSHQQVGAI